MNRLGKPQEIGDFVKSIVENDIKYRKLQEHTAEFLFCIIDKVDKLNGKLNILDNLESENKKLKLDKPTLWSDEDLPAAHFAVHKNWINTLGYLAPPFFWHWHVDSYTQKVARKLNRCLYLPTVVFKAKKMFDETGKQVRHNLNINNRDNFVWDKVQRHLRTDIKALQDLIKDQSTQ